MGFDARVFAIAYCLLGHVQLFFMDWFTEGIRSVAKYLAAKDRIQVCSIIYESLMITTFLNRNFCN